MTDLPLIDPPLIDPPLIDGAILDEVVAQIGEEAAQAVLELFRGECRTLVASIADGLARPTDAKGRAAAERAAHSLKSSAGQIGAALLAERARQVESGFAGGRADLAALVGALAACAEATAAALAARTSGA